MQTIETKMYNKRIEIDGWIANEKSVCKIKVYTMRFSDSFFFVLYVASFSFAGFHVAVYFEFFRCKSQYHSN